MGGEEVRLWIDRWLPALPSGHPSPSGGVSMTRSTREETIEHLFLLCPWVNSIWFGGALTYIIQLGSFSSWGVWLHAVFTSNLGSLASKDRVQTYVLVTCWHIWKSRCDYVFNQVPIIPSKVIMGIGISVAEFFNARLVPENSQTVDRGWVRQICRWTPHVSPFVKLNVDASWSRLNNSGFAAVVARDARGDFIAAVRYPIFASCVAMAEALALLRGCELAVSLNFSSVIF
ncbi:uncharacterized protein LOC126617132 [Malus sylvestris]|uniref:uncharacterized protein LOC126617132 n=1 Tax=Malus sylvestris TaxID=3752 RepID=UPI0021AC38BC|nr:uncharacterized protein LOC126617132 [Malus sylvestris]